MAKNVPARRPSYLSSSSPAPRSVLNRSMTPEEAIADSFVQMARVRTITGIGRLGQEAVAAMEQRRQELITELPEANELLWALEANTARLIAGIQQAAANDHRDVIL